MRALIVTGLSPLVNNAFSGVAVTERLKRYREYCQLRVISPVNTVSSDILGSVSRRFSKYPGKSLRLSEKLEIEYPRYFTIPRDNAIEKIVRKTILDWNPDLVITHWGPTGWGTCRAAKGFSIPHVQFFHGSDIHDMRFKNRSSIDKTRRLMADSDICFFVSEGLKKIAERTLGTPKVSLATRNGVDKNIFRVLPKIRTLRKKRKLVGFVGRFEEIKGVDSIPEIMRRLKEMAGSDNFGCVMVGEGRLKKVVVSQLLAMGVDTTSVGFVDQVKLCELMNTMDVLILPSRNEGWGSVVIEALACGTPVVASRVGGVPEVMGNSYNGILVERMESFEREFARAIHTLLEEPKDPLLLSGYADAFSWRTIVETEFASIGETLRII